MPVTKPDFVSSSNHSTVPKSSSASPKRPIGVERKILSVRGVGVPSSLKRSALFCAETRKPGAIALQRIPVPAK